MEPASGGQAWTNLLVGGCTQPFIESCSVHPHHGQFQLSPSQPQTWWTLDRLLSQMGSREPLEWAGPTTGSTGFGLVWLASAWQSQAEL